MIDLHCHILPAVDDGPETMEIAVAMARIAAEDGIETIVATPHVRERITAPELIAQGCAALNREIDGAGVPLTVVPGGEVYALLDRELFRGYGINGSSHVLVEFPYHHMPADWREILYELTVEGLTPIMSHPERNPSILADPYLLLGDNREDFLVQITAASLTGDFGPACRECALFLLRKGRVDFIATDSHSPAMRRPVLTPALKVAEKVVGKEQARRLVLDNPAKVLGGGGNHG